MVGNFSLYKDLPQIIIINMEKTKKANNKPAATKAPSNKENVKARSQSKDKNRLSKKENRASNPKDDDSEVTIKRPMNAYMYFSNERRKALLDDGMKAKEAMKELSKLWKSATSVDKRKYQKMADEDKARWEKAKEEAKNAKPNEKKKKRPDTPSERSKSKGKKARAKKPKSKKQESSDDDGSGDEDSE